jgi:hypothetical protein
LIDEKVSTPRGKLKGVANLYGVAATTPGLSIDLSTPKKVGNDDYAKSKNGVITPESGSGGWSSRRNRLVRKRKTNPPEKSHKVAETQEIIELKDSYKTVDVHEE